MRRGLSLVKKGVFSAVIVLVLVVIIELLASVAGARITGRRFSSARLQRQRDALVANAGRVAINPNAQWLQDEILHPYVGYTPVPRGAGTSAGVAGAVATALPTRSPDRVTIAFVGGSFAVAFAEHAEPRLIARLSELPAFRGKKLVSLNLAVGGYKQPQQLMSIAYLLSLGGELDLLINLDGFNDIALHPTENAPARVSPAFPRRWHRRIDGILHSGASRLMVLRVQLEQRRAPSRKRSRRSRGGTSIWRISSTSSWTATSSSASPPPITSCWAPSRPRAPPPRTARRSRSRARPRCSPTSWVSGSGAPDCWTASRAPTERATTISSSRTSTCPGRSRWVRRNGPAP